MSEHPAQPDALTHLVAVRVDTRGRTLCHAHTSDGRLCSAPAVTGQQVCRHHGGSTIHAKRAAMVRLLDLAPDAIDALADAVRNAPEVADRIKAANSILDRTGYARTARVSKEDAWEMVVARVQERREAIGGPGDVH